MRIKTPKTYPLTKETAAVLVAAYFGDVEAIEAVRNLMVEMADWVDTEDIEDAG